MKVQSPMSKAQCPRFKVEGDTPGGLGWIGLAAVLLQGVGSWKLGDGR